MKYLFVDFDGVLHPSPSKGELFSQSKIFCDSLVNHKDNFLIVMSSSWRETYDYEDIIEAFEPTIRDRVVGVTPILENNLHPLGRYHEIIAYCEQNQILDSDWVAIDDMAHLFPKKCPNLILTNPQTGITEKELQILENLLRKPKNQAKP